MLRIVHAIYAEAAFLYFCRRLEYDIAKWQRPNRLIFAAVDNMCHGLLAFLSWLVLVVVYRRKDIIFFGAVSFVLGSLMDIDHFLEAGSLKLERALSLPRRPIFHNTPLTFLLSILLYTAVKVISNDQKLAVLSSLCLFNAWITHQLRDALRRGLWMYPVMANREPLSMFCYLSYLLVLFLFELFVLEMFYYSSKNGVNVEEFSFIL